MLVHYMSWSSRNTVDQWVEEQVKQIETLPESLRPIATDLIGHIPESATQVSRYDRGNARAKGARQLAGLPTSERNQIWQCITPELASSIALAWERVEHHESFTQAIVGQILPYKRTLTEWAAEPRPKFTFHEGAQKLAQLIVAVVDTGSAEGDALFAQLLAQAQSADADNPIGHHVVHVLLKSNREAGWKQLATMLDAPEGTLRWQSVAEWVRRHLDSAPAAAFELLFTQFHQLERHAELTEEICRWLGWRVDAKTLPNSPTFDIGRVVDVWVELIASAEAHQAALSGTHPLNLFLALTVEGRRDKLAAIQHAAERSADADLATRYAAVDYLRVARHDAATEPLLARLSDADRRIATCALLGLARAQPAGVPSKITAVGLAQRDRFAAQPEQEPPLLWPWAGQLLSQSEWIAQLLHCLNRSYPLTSADLEPLLPYVSKLPTAPRAMFANQLYKIDTFSPALRKALFKLVADRSDKVSWPAEIHLEKLTFSADDIQQAETLLKRKSTALQATMLKLLTALDDDMALASAERLLYAKAASQQSASLKLLLALAEAERRVDDCVALAEQAVGERKLSQADAKLFSELQALAPKPTTQLSSFEQVEAEWLAQIPNWTLANGLGLYDPTQRTPVQTPQPHPELCTPQHVENGPRLLAELSTLLREQRNTVVEFIDAENKPHSRPLSQLFDYDIRLPRYDRRKSTEENIAAYPLANVWIAWWEGQSAEVREPQQFGLRRFLVYLAARAGGRRFRQAEPGPNDDAIYGRTDHPYGAPYVRYMRWIVEWLVELWWPLDHLDRMLDMLEHELASVGLSNSRETVLHWAEHLEEDLRRHGSSWQPRHLIHHWQLMHYFDQPQPDWHRLFTKFDIVMAAYRLGAANQHDLFDELIHRCGCAVCADKHARSARGAALNRFGKLSDVSKPPSQLRLYADADLQVKVDALRRRIVAIEVRRGQEATEVSKVALKLGWTGGLECVIPLLHYVEADDLSYGDGTGRPNTYRWRVLSRLAQRSHPRPDDTIEQFVEQVGQINVSAETLLDFALLAPQWARYVETVLDWPGLHDVIWWHYAHIKDSDWRDHYEPLPFDRRVPLSQLTPLLIGELLEGAADGAWLIHFAAQIDAKRWTQLKKAIGRTNLKTLFKRAMLYADALRGKLDEAKLIDRIDKKRHQDSVRALGLLPLPSAEADTLILARYEVIQRFYAGRKKYGAQRQQNETRTTEIALANLARTAGYPDPQRLEWAMELNAVADLMTGPISASVSPTTVTLSVDALGNAQLAVDKGGKKLKAVPAKLKKHPDIKPLLDRKKALTDQARRMRKSLEQSMRRGDTFIYEELTRLLQHPVLRPMLEALVFVGDDAIGYLRGPVISSGKQDDGQQTTDDDKSIVHRRGEAAIVYRPNEQLKVSPQSQTMLAGYDGKMAPVSADAALRIAHPHDLYANGRWHDWQRDCFIQARVQPFRQVFRELYVVTPAEQASGVFSSRYAGQRVLARQARRLLESTGWVVSHSDMPRRTFHNANLTVYCDFAGHFFYEETVTLGTVHFTRAHTYEQVPLAAVPPRIFSAAMRSLDLVVSVAYDKSGGSAADATESTVEMRAALVAQTTQLLKLTNVTVDGNRVLIDGSLNNYSVHLGSGVVHQRPGGYLCIVPIRPQQRSKIYLPFVDEDEKSAEIIAKVVLLARDHKIKDRSILAQIRPQ